LDWSPELRVFFMYEKQDLLKLFQESWEGGCGRMIEE
jgi:hypothetical protein